MNRRHRSTVAALILISAVTLAARPGVADRSFDAPGEAEHGSVQGSTAEHGAVVWRGAEAADTQTRTGDGIERIRLVTAEQGNVARFRVREQLARLDFPNDAVGETREVRGAIVLEPDGRVVREESRFEVDLSTLQSDSDRRDNFIRRRTLDTDTYPTAVFVPAELRGLPAPVPTEGKLEFEVVGEMTIRDVTRPITWQVTASADGGAYIGTARTSFDFGTFELDIPRVGSVLSIRDEIRLEYEFLVGAPPARQAKAEAKAEAKGR